MLIDSYRNYHMSFNPRIVNISSKSISRTSDFDLYRPNLSPSHNNMKVGGQNLPLKRIEKTDDPQLKSLRKLYKASKASERRSKSLMN